jgi:hypothetical protein
MQLTCCLAPARDYQVTSSAAASSSSLHHFNRYRPRKVCRLCVLSAFLIRRGASPPPKPKAGDEKHAASGELPPPPRRGADKEVAKPKEQPPHEGDAQMPDAKPAEKARVAEADRAAAPMDVDKAAPPKVPGYSLPPCILGSASVYSFDLLLDRCRNQDSCSCCVADL